MTSSPGVSAAAVPTLLLAALPSLREEWSSEVEEDNADPDCAGGRLHYLDASWVVGHLVDRLAAGDPTEVAATFALVERLIRDGDPYVSELGIIGYLEGVQNLTRSRDLDPAAFLDHLGPLSLRYWAALDDFWSHGTPIPRLDR